MGSFLLDRIKENNEWIGKLEGLPAYNIGVLSNIVVNQLKESLELPLRREKINARVDFGDYDNIVQDSLKFQSHQAVVIFWEACNFIDGLNYRSLAMSRAETDQLLQRLKAEIQLAIDNLRTVPIVVINKFSSLIFNRYFLQRNNFDFIVDELNRFLSEAITPNCFLLDIDKIVAQVGVQAAFNKRFWYSSKMLYTIDYFEAYGSQVAPVFLSVLGKSRKALIVDCDNTLWKGVVGEDQVMGIAKNSKQKDGIYFEEVHYLAKSLAQKGIVLGINSKNNYEDVEAVFKNKEDIAIDLSDFVITKINWNDKVTNLKEIALGLNIGVDSLVHLDDSDFELKFIEQELSGVKIVKVPSSLPDYPEVFRKNMSCFFNLKTTREDIERVDMYKTQQQRDEIKTKFEDIESYLRSLQLEMSVQLNNYEEIARIAQMSQKTNQFNLTTIRYTEGEIEQKMKDGNHFIFSFGLKDKFGDYGTTGLCIVNKEDKATVRIDTFLMSCRIIGRKAEVSFFNFLVHFLKKQGFEVLKATYLKSFKNIQVENFYDNLNLQPNSKQEERKDYMLKLSGFVPEEINYIKLSYGK